MDFSMFGGGAQPAKNDLSQELAMNIDKKSHYLRLMKRIKVKFTAAKDPIGKMNAAVPDRSNSNNES